MKNLVLVCLIVITAIYFSSCNRSDISPVSTSTIEPSTTAGIGDYNSCPWNWNMPFIGSAYVTCGYGCGYHTGNIYYSIDLSGGGAASGEPVKASASGYVQYADWDPNGNWGYGNQVIVEAGPTGQPNGNRYLYRVAHLSSISVQAGWWVEKGTVLGYVGSTGNSTGAHIHFEIRRGSYAGYGGIYGDSFPPDYDTGIDGYDGCDDYCQISSEFQ
ncbi:MAG: M23 family metallopeptidase [Patescibacteria group bacterium]